MPTKLPKNFKYSDFREAMSRDKKILSNNKNLNFDNFDKIEKNLTKLSVAESLKMIKLNLGNIGINHDNFVNETDIVKSKEVEKVIEGLKKKNFVFHLLLMFVRNYIKY